MKIDKDRLLFYIGTGFLILALIECTLFPFIINRYFPSAYIPNEILKNAVAALYFIAFILYAFSGKFFYRQIQAIIVIFALFVLFSVFYKII